MLQDGRHRSHASDRYVAGRTSQAARIKTLCYRTDVTGRMRQINYNNSLQKAQQTFSLEQVKPMYKALTLFEAMLMDPKYSIHHKMSNGTSCSNDAIVFAATDTASLFYLPC